MTPEDWTKMEQMNRELLAEVTVRLEASNKREESGLTPDDAEGIIRCVKAANETQRKENDAICNFWLVLSVVFLMFMMLLSHR